MKQIVGLLAVVMVLVLGINAHAIEIEFTHTGIGSGTLAGNGFFDCAFTIIALGDTDNRQAAGSLWWIPHDSASISIESLGLFEFNVYTATFVENYTLTAGLCRSDAGGDYDMDLYDGPSNALLGNWDMLSSIGPIADSDFELLQWDWPSVQTTGGTLEFYNEENISGTFEAKIIPEPSTLIMLGMGFVGIFCVRRRK